MMKAVILNTFGSSDHFQLADVPTPLPKSGEVRVRVHAAGFNPADYQARQALHGEEVALPLILGLDIAGTVDMIGEGVTDVQVGDAVFGYLPTSRRSNGGYAEYVCVSPAFLAPLPDNLSFAQGASLPTVALTAYQCLAGQVPIMAGQPLFISGASGGVGTIALQIAMQLGAEPIITTSGSPASFKYLTEILRVEPHHILQYQGRSLQELIQEALQLNQSMRYPVTLDCVGGQMTSLCCHIVDAFGHVISIVDGPRDNADIDMLFLASAAFHTIQTSTTAIYQAPEQWADYHNQLFKMSAWMMAGKLISPSLTILSLSVQTVREAHQRLESHHVQGKIVMMV